MVGKTEERDILRISKLSLSLGGLDVPVLTITDNVSE